MRWGRVEATAGFFLLVAWMNYWDSQCLIPAALLACALHELGHFWAIRLLGSDVKLIRLTAIGAEMAVDRPLDYWREGLAALAGPAVNLLLALMCCGWSRGQTFAGLNLALALFNLLPVGRLDGGRALGCALALLAGPNRAERIGRGLDLLCAGAALGAGLLVAGAAGNVTLLLAGLWMAGMISQENWRPFRPNRACHRGEKPVKYRVR